MGTRRSPLGGLLRPEAPVCLSHDLAPPHRVFAAAPESVGFLARWGPVMISGRRAPAWQCVGRNSAGKLILTDPGDDETEDRQPLEKHLAEIEIDIVERGTH